MIQVEASISISCSSTTREVVGRIGIRRYAMGKEDTGQGAEGVSRVGVKQMVGSEMHWHGKRLRAKRERRS